MLPGAGCAWRVIASRITAKVNLCPLVTHARPFDANNDAGKMKHLDSIDSRRNAR
jgi:hypothetical protein